MKLLMDLNLPQLAQLASGRRIVNMCMFAWLAAAAFHVTETPIAVLFFFGSTMAAIIGTLRVTEGLGHAGLKTALLVVGAAIPIVGLLVMAWLSTCVTKALSSAGYQVGMFVADKGGAD